MSTTALVLFKDGKTDCYVEFQNSWGGVAFIWTALYDRYLKNPEIPYDSWCSEAGSKRLWQLTRRADLRDFERICLAFTFDNCLVRREHFAPLAAHLREFAAAYPTAGVVCHLPAWADEIEHSAAEAIGLYATSCGDDPWHDRGADSEDWIPYDMATGTRHWDPYDYLAELAKADVLNP